MICDKCGKDITEESADFDPDCPECGRNLCYDCAGGWENVDCGTVCADCAEWQEGNNG